MARHNNRVRREAFGIYSPELRARVLKEARPDKETAARIGKAQRLRLPPAPPCGLGAKPPTVNTAETDAVPPA